MNSKFEVVRFSFDGTGKSVAKSVKDNLTETAAKSLRDKLNEKQGDKDLKGEGTTIVAYGCCPMRQRVVGDLVAHDNSPIV